MSSTLKNTLFRSFRWFDLVLITLVTLSLFILLMPASWLTKRLEIHPQNLPVKLSKDSSGLTRVNWLNEQQQIWRCQFGAGVSPAFCGMVITTINEAWRGLNLTDYDKMIIEAEFEGEMENLRIYLRNRHIDYFRMGDETSTKYNTVEVPISYLKGTPIDMTKFKVADWWTASHHIAITHTKPEFDDIIFVEFQSGTKGLNNNPVIQIKRIAWEGKYISDELLYRSLSVLWVIVFLASLLIKLALLNRDIKRNQLHQEELVTINKLLNLQNRQFEELATTDVLTGVNNRIGIRTALLEGLNQWRTLGSPFSLILLDVDHFKKINDTHGHDVGDKVLQGLAHLLSKLTRTGDAISRWGGEEFIITCPKTTIEQATALAEDIRRQLENTELVEGINTTASFGVASLTRGDLEQLIKQADIALYKAKNSGRNCVAAQAALKEP